MRNICVGSMQFISNAWQRLQRFGEFLELTRVSGMETDRIARDLGLSASERIQTCTGGAVWCRWPDANSAVIDTNLGTLNTKAPEYAPDLARLCALCDV